MVEPGAQNRAEIARIETFLKTSPLDGSVVPLRKQVNGNDLLLTSRHIRYPFTQFGKYASADPNKSFLLFNIFGAFAHEQVPVGFMDWEITNDTAKCAYQQGYVSSNSALEKLAVEAYMGDNHGFAVEDEFQENGIGNFLIALSLKTLQRIDVPYVNPGKHVTPNSSAQWKKFGIETEYDQDRKFSLPIASAHPHVIRSLAAFI